MSNAEADFGKEDEDYDSINVAPATVNQSKKISFLKKNSSSTVATIAMKHV